MYSYSVSIIVPAAHKADADKLSTALGHAPPGVPTFVAELSSDGVNVTHYGCHTYAQEAFINLLSAAALGDMPPGLEAYRDAVAALQIQIAKGTVDDTWPACKEAAGVQNYEHNDKL